MSTVFHYGIPYMGSKDKIAQSLIREMPSGQRFCDLFGGGFAMSHAAFLSDKWDEVLYNEDVFNHQEFYEWVYTRDFPVYFSSYEISDNRFELLFAKRRTGTLGATNAEERYERLWANKKGAILWQKYHSN